MSDWTPRQLDWTKPQETVYAIPLWLRDLQIKENIARVPGRIEPYTGPPRTEPIAVVGYGPSLRDTWEEIRDFKWVMTCSGSHRFLIDRGIVPQWHMAVDPLPKNTVDLIGEPHPDVEYLICSACNPDVVKHLEAHAAKIKLWHVFDSSDEGVRILPRGEWSITGGCDVGLRALAMAAFFGFKDIHVFGMDGNARPEGRHAGAHPRPLKKYDEVVYNGVTYQTTAGMLEAARQVWHELDEMPAVDVTFHGEGLIQEMAKDYHRKPSRSSALTNVVGFTRPELISPEMVELNARLHRDNLHYGVGGGKHADKVKLIVDKLTTRDKDGKAVIPSVLDYGCGKSMLAKALPWPIWEYDPAIPAKAELPRPADVVCCFDVLEHIEPDKLSFVLDDLRRCVQKLGYFVIHTMAAQKTYADGRNTHLIQKGRGWWQAKLSKFFTVARINENGPELHVIVTTKVPEKPKTSIAAPTLARRAPDYTNVVPRVFIGFDRRQPLAYTVARSSVERYAKGRMWVEPLRIDWLDVNRCGLTEFTYTRYLVPWLCEFKGMAIFMDGDMIAQSDVGELLTLVDPKNAVSVVQGGERFEWPSLMVFNCAHLACHQLTPGLLNKPTATPNTLAWAEGEIGALPPEWNYCVGYDDPKPDAKIIHYTAGIPCWPETEQMPAASLWHAEKDYALSTVSWEALMGKSVHRHIVEELATV